MGWEMQVIFEKVQKARQVQTEESVVKIFKISLS